jgi:hypothetical protein
VLAAVEVVEVMEPAVASLPEELRAVQSGYLGLGVVAEVAEE